MYIQITERCNMSCDHCAFSCGRGGHDMPPEVFKEALEYAGGFSCLGGGEPTLHPNFWHYLIDAIATPYSEEVWLATNGSQTEIALKLAVLAEKGIIGCALSQDQWHDQIDPRVVKAFSNTKRHEGDGREIRDVTGNLINAGRAKENEIADLDYACPCDTEVIKYDGRILACGCEDAAEIGNVMKGGIYNDEIYNELQNFGCWTAYQRSLKEDEYYHPGEVS